LDEIQNIDKKVQDRNTPIFLYCHSGVRSSKAAKILRKMGYCNVKSIGGIAKYKGQIVK
ncbi:MAG: rhodanese-like domain-containing protein, partial [Butyrivibrio sp.]|nr:rhodanese-like domain-containing protein [Butyrivibrio sp.]